MEEKKKINYHDFCFICQYYDECVVCVHFKGEKISKNKDMETSKLEFRENLQRAASFDANRTYPALFQHLGYRKKIAEDLLHSGNEEDTKYLLELYDRINHEIKLIIGL